MPSNDCIMRHGEYDPISVLNRMVGNLSQTQHDNFGTVQPPSQVPLSSYSQPYQSHQPQPSTTQPQLSELQAGIDGNDAGTLCLKNNNSYQIDTSFVLMEGNFVCVCA